MEQRNVCGKNIKNIRCAKGKSLEYIAKFLQLRGIRADRQSVYAIETGDRILTDVEAVLIAESLGVPLEELVKKSDIDFSGQCGKI